MLRNPKRIQVHILNLSLEELLVLLTFIELLTVLKQEYKAWQLLQTSQYRICKLRLPLVNNLPSLCTGRHSFFFLTAHTVSTRCFLHIMVLNVLFTMGLAKIYLVVTIKICLEFAKMGQSTDKNKLLRQILAWCACARPRSSHSFCA